jgi:hypothetical protein
MTVPSAIFLNDRSLNIRGVPLFRHLLKFRLGIIGIWVAVDSGNPPAAREAVDVR